MMRRVNKQKTSPHQKPRNKYIAPCIICHLNTSKEFPGTYRKYVKEVIKRACQGNFIEDGVSILPNVQQRISNIAICYQRKRIYLHIENDNFYLLGLNPGGKQNKWCSILKEKSDSMFMYKVLGIGAGYKDFNLPLKGSITKLKLSFNKLKDAFLTIYDYLEYQRRELKNEFKSSLGIFVLYFCEGARFGEVLQHIALHTKLPSQSQTFRLDGNLEGLIKGWVKEQSAYFEDWLREFVVKELLRRGWVTKGHKKLNEWANRIVMKYTGEGIEAKKYSGQLRLAQVKQMITYKELAGDILKKLKLEDLDDKRDENEERTVTDYPMVNEDTYKELAGDILKKLKLEDLDDKRDENEERTVTDYPMVNEEQDD